MRLTLVGVSLAALAAACRVDSSPPPPSQSLSPSGVKRGASRPDGPSGGHFTCRTDSGEARPLALRKLALRVTTGPGTVRSHLTMEVAGPASERVEAFMRLPVPRGAAVTQAILWVNGRPMNGAFVERDRAREIYRSIVARRRDPALVTWDGAGWVAVSIFPLEHGEARRFELEWVEPAAIEGGLVQYRVPTVVDAGRVIGRPSLEVDGHALSAGSRDVVALAPDPARAVPIVAARSPGDPFHRLLVRAAPAEGPPRLVIVAETSQAMNAGERVPQRAALDALLAALPAGAKVTLTAADWDISTIAEDVDAAEARRALAKLDGIVSAGALHLERALADAAARARKTAATAVLFVGRGQDGFGGDALRAPLRQLREAGVRLSVVATSDVPPPLADAAALTGGEALPARDLPESLGALIDALHPRPPRPALTARGSDDWRALETFTGQTVWIGRALETPRSPAGTSDPVAAADAADLLPLWDRARLAWSDREGRTAGDRMKPTALTPMRALLVLETEQDYARYGLATPEPIDAPRHLAEEGKMGKRERLFGLKSASNDTPPAPGSAEEQTRQAGILGTLQQIEASRPTSIFGRSPAIDRDSAIIGQAYGVGALGTLGTGSGGGGTGEGTLGLGNLGTIGAISGIDGSHGNGSGFGRGAGGLGGRRARAPAVIPGQANVRGTLDKEIIRRIIRRHINEVRTCYEQELTKKPDLGGRIIVQFTIAASGQVIASVLQSSTMGNARVESCIVQAVRRWEFPQPLGGGLVIVSYPFVLTPNGAAAEAAASQPEPPVEPDRVTLDALAILAERGPLADRVERIARLLGLDQTSEPENVAWMIDRPRATLPQITLVARLLEAANRRQDAIRVLSERAAAEPVTIAAELRHLGAEPDAAEVLTLAKRGR